MNEETERAGSKKCREAEVLIVTERKNAPSHTKLVNARDW